MLLWYHSRCEPYGKHEPDHATSYAVSKYLGDLIEAGLIEKDGRVPPQGVKGSGFRTTEKGRFYVEALCSLPLPVNCWKIPKDEL